MDRIHQCELIAAEQLRLAFVSRDKRRRLVELVVKEFDRQVAAFPSDKPKADTVVAEIHDEAKTFLPWLAMILLQFLVMKLLEWLWNNWTQNQEARA